MSYSIIAFIAPNYRDFKTWWLKAYEPGTTTPKPGGMATDSTLSTFISKAELNADGFIESAGGTLIIPYIDGAYDLWLFPTAAEADANDTVNAERLADNVIAVSSNSISDDIINDISQEYILDTVSLYKSSTIDFPLKKVISITEDETGKGGSSIWDVVLTSTVTPNDENIVTSDQFPTKSIVQRRNGSITVEIPADFTTLQSAVDYYMSSDTYADKFVDLWIADGHLITGGIGCFHGNFSRFRVRSRNDAIVKLDPTFVGVDTSGVPSGVLGETPRAPLFFGFDATLPELWCVVDMENLYGTGIQLAEANCFVNQGDGVINAGFRGIQVHGRANVYAADFSGAAGSAIRLQQASSCNARSAICDDSCKTDDLTNSAIYVSRSSLLEFRGGSAQRSGASGLIARRSIVTADDANFGEAADKGIEAETCAQVSFANGSALDCVGSAIRCIGAANVYAVGVASSTASAALNFDVDTGGVITVAGSNTVEGVANTEDQTILESNVLYTNAYDGENGMIFFDAGNGTFKITSNADGVSQRFADGRMIAWSGAKVIDTGIIAAGAFTAQLTLPILPDTFITTSQVTLSVVGRTSAGGGGNRLAADSYDRGLSVGDEWKVRNVGEQLDGIGTGLNMQSINVSMMTHGTWR